MGLFDKTYQWVKDHIPGRPSLPGAPTIGGAPTTPPKAGGVVLPQFPPPAAALNDPPYPPLVSNAARTALFGSFDYESDPSNDNPERIRIIGGWREKNIIWVPVPQLKGIPGVEYDGSPFPRVAGMWFHRLGAHQLQGMWTDWERAGLLHYVKTFEGSFAPRFVRGSQTNLSNHCFGNAFDINYAWNTLGATPAQWGERGSVRELVPISIKWGFYWGGFYHTRKDGMHFEVARLMP